MLALRSALAALTLLGALLAHAQAIVGSGRPATVARAVGSFTGVQIAVPAQVEIVQGASESLAVTADDNIEPAIEAVIQGQVLRIRARDANLEPKTPIRLAIRVRTLESIEIAGSADVRLPALEAPRLSVLIQGAGDVRIGTFKGGSLKGAIRGSGKLAAAGRAEMLEIHVAGSGDVDAGHLEAGRATISITGTGDVAAWARDELRVSLAGAGEVRYYGDPRVEKKITGSGALRRLGAAPG